MRLTGSRTYYRPSPPKMPPGLVELMEGLTREVLKHNPSNIHEFCANHVQQLLEKRDGPSNKKSLLLEQKIARAQQKVRQRAEIRKQEIDKIFSEEQSYGDASNVANKESNIASIVPMPQTNVIGDLNKVDIEPNNDTLNVRASDQIMESSLKAPVHHENELEKSSEVEVYHKSGLDTITQKQTYDGETSPTQANDVNVDSVVNITDKVKSEMSSSLLEGHLEGIDNKDSIINPVEKQAVVDDLTSSEVSVSKKEEPHLFAAEEQNTITYDEKVIVSESVHINEDASIIVDDLDSKQIPRIEKEESIASMTQIQDAKQNSSEGNEKLGLPKSVSLVEDATITINDLDPEQVYVTEKVESISPITPIHDVQNSGDDYEKTIADEDAVIKIDEGNILHLVGTAKSNSDLENGNNSSDIRDTSIDIQIEQKEKLGDSVDMQDDASDISQTDESVKEVDYNTISVTLENKVASSLEKLAAPTAILHTQEKEDNVSSDLLAFKNNQSRHENIPAEDYNESTSKEPEAVKVSSAVVDSYLIKSDQEHVPLDSTEANSVVKNNEASNKFDPKKTADSDRPTLGNVDHETQIIESIRSSSAINDDENLPEETKVILDKSLIVLSPEINNFDGSDRHQNSRNSLNDLLANSSSVPIHVPEIVNYNDIEINSYIPIENDSEKDNHQNSGMDLETAAITIQKVFRSFLFKSRGSISEDVVNDDTMFLDDDISKEACDFPIESPKNLDRRAHGITRMDTVLQTVNEEKSLSLSTDDSSTLSSAATIIQAHVRGFLVRNKLNSNKTNSSLAASISNDLLVTPVDPGNDQQSKTVLNIHIVPESGDDLSRDESLITSMDLSLDSPSSTNLHPSNDDKSDRRKRLKREDAIQSVSPPSNNSGKLSDEVDPVKEIAADSLLNESNSIKTELSNAEDRKNASKEESLLQDTETKKNSIENIVDTVDNELKLNQKRKSLTKMNSDERDVVTPYASNDESGLLHSGEFHDAVVPTKVSRSDTSVVSEFKNVLVYFLLWNHS